jgi:glycosyltransferase involved in cell wall biosynthesis
VVGDGGITVDPKNLKALADRMEEALFDEDVRERLIQAGRERGQQFSWKKTAEQTLTNLGEVAK